MTDYQKYINALRKCAKEHENDRTSTGHIIVSDLCRDTANLLEALEQETRWIPVSERLPEDHIEVLLNDGDCMSVGYVYYTWDEKLKWHVDCNDEENNFYLNPIAWMPLPDIQIRK